MRMFPIKFKWMTLRKYFKTVVYKILKINGFSQLVFISVGSFSFLEQLKLTLCTTSLPFAIQCIKNLKVFYVNFQQIFQKHHPIKIPTKSVPNHESVKSTGQNLVTHFPLLLDILISYVCEVTKSSIKIF